MGFFTDWMNKKRVEAGVATTIEVRESQLQDRDKPKNKPDKQNRIFESLRGVDDKHIVKVGDRYKFTYTLPIIRSDKAVISFLSDIKRDKRWEIVTYQLIPARNKLIVDVKIIKNPFPIAILIVAFSATFVSLFLYLSLDSVEEIISKPAGALFMGAVGILGLYMAWRALK